MGSGSRTLDQRFPCDLITESDINQHDSAFLNSRDESFPDQTNAYVLPLPFDHHKVVFRLRDGLNLGAWPQPSDAQAIGVAAGIDAALLNELIIRIPTDLNLAVISTSDENLAAELQKVHCISLGLNQHAVQAYVAAADNSCKGVVPGSQPNTTMKTLLENLRYSESPILHARMMASTNQALVTFSGIQVPRHVRLYGAELRCYIYRPRQQICSVCLSMGHRADVGPTPDKPHCVACGTFNPLPEHECTPKCIHSGGNHPATDPRCPSRHQRPFNKSYVLQERLKREKRCPPPGSDQPTKTPEKSAEQPPTSGRSSTHGPTGHDR
ncbi:hypothetical protein HPB49_020686 [Dermacentor silvarum]|uniref:Uncharacterized protein n=1 Tax=Dermacentor silvarum TaxID=543639 RepID=A0ACB8DKV0_DERSI|nr:hypothetical protein HPB49_020686 [Dermacentor silvarum]